MRILQFVPYFLPYVGGQERYVYNLSKYLVKLGHDVHVITSNFPLSKNFEIIDGITVERYNIIARPLRNPIALGFFEAAKKFKNFDIVHIHNEHAFSSIVAAHAKTKENFPLVLTNHGRLIFGSRLADFIEKIYMKKLGRKILELSDAIVVNSIYDRDFLSKINPRIAHKIYVVHNAIDLEAIEKLREETKIDRDIERKWTLIKKNINILYVGRLIKRKGIEWLIKAMKTIKDLTNEKIKCIIVGEGEDKNYFEALVSKLNLRDLIIFAGAVSDKELVWLYENSDIFVLPSLSEGCSTSILEAMYFGLPVITTNIPGNREHFKNVSILVPPRDEKTLAHSILMVLMNKDLASKLSREGKRLVKKEYSWNKVSKIYEKVYLRILANKIE